MPRPAAQDGTLALALQWNGAALATPPLLAVHRPGEASLTYRAAPETLQRRLRNYAGSVAIAPDGGRIAVTAPRGGLMFVFDAAGSVVATVSASDLCGVAPAGTGFACTSGEGRFLAIDAAGAVQAEAPGHGFAFDNHLVAV